MPPASHHYAQGDFWHRCLDALPPRDVNSPFSETSKEGRRWGISHRFISQETIVCSLFAPLCHFNSTCFHLFLTFTHWWGLDNTSSLQQTYPLKNMSNSLHLSNAITLCHHKDTLCVTETHHHNSTENESRLKIQDLVYILPLTYKTHRVTKLCCI